MKPASKKQERTIHVISKDGKFKVYDAQSRYRAGFGSQAEADAYAARLMSGGRPFVTTESHL